MNNGSKTSWFWPNFKVTSYMLPTLLLVKETSQKARMVANPFFPMCGKECQFHVHTTALLWYEVGGFSSLIN